MPSLTPSGRPKGDAFRQGECGEARSRGLPGGRAGTGEVGKRGYVSEVLVDFAALELFGGSVGVAFGSR